MTAEPTPLEPAIRLYQPDDLAVCRHLWVVLTERHRQIYDSDAIGGDDPGARFDTYLADPKLIGPWVGEIESRVVCLTGLLVDRDGSEAEIEPVVVEPEYRSRGIGSTLLRFLMDEARTRDIESLRIRPVARNADAITCFHRAGFQTLGHIEMFIKLGTSTTDWKLGIDIHGNPFRY